MKVTVRLIGDGLARADTLANDLRRRAIEHLEARATERRQEPRSAPMPPAPATTPPRAR